MLEERKERRRDKEKYKGCRVERHPLAGAWTRKEEAAAGGTVGEKTPERGKGDGERIPLKKNL